MTFSSVMSMLNSPSTLNVSGPRPMSLSTPSALKILSASSWWTNDRPGIITVSFISLKSSFSKSSFVIRQAISFSHATILTFSPVSNLENILVRYGSAIFEVMIVASPVIGLINCRNTSFSSLAIANGPPVSGSHTGVPLTLNLYSEFICLTSSPNSSTGCD